MAEIRESEKLTWVQAFARRCMLYSVPDFTFEGREARASEPLNHKRGFTMNALRRQRSTKLLTAVQNKNNQNIMSSIASDCGVTR